MDSLKHDFGLYRLHSEPSILNGSAQIVKLRLSKEIKDRQETLDETGEIINDELISLMKLMDGRNATIEQYIVSDDSWAGELVISYSLNVIKGRWKEGEEYLIKTNDAYEAKRYAMMHNFRFKEAEPLIMKSATLIIDYSIDVLGERWKEAESILKEKDESLWFEYAEYWGIPE